MTEKENMNIKVEIDSKSLEDKIIENQNLRSEIEQLKTDLTLIAEKELQKQSKFYGCEPTIEAVTSAKTRGSTALLNDQQLGNNVDNDSFNSENEAILAISKAKKNGNKNSALIEQKLLRKFLENPINLEYSGNLKDLALKPQKLSCETPEAYSQRLDESKLKQKWKNLNDVNSGEE